MIGIMQGRLTKPKGRGIQFFPFDNWKHEFEVAKEIGLDEIEFIFDYDNYTENPLWKQQGISIAEIMKNTGVQVRSICFDYFMRKPFYKYSGENYDIVKKENLEILTYVLETMKALGIGLIEIPLVDNSSLKSVEEAKQFAEFIKSVLPVAGDKVKIGLETDLPPNEFKQFLDYIGEEQIGANYDSGNSSGMGYDAYEEVTVLNQYIFNIHIKDRVFQGTTVELGTGDANFSQLFRGLQKIKYKGTFILQAARTEEGHEKENIEKQINFVKGYLKNEY